MILELKVCETKVDDIVCESSCKVVKTVDGTMQMEAWERM